MGGPAIPMLLAALALCGCGAVVLWLARRGRDGRLPRNRVAGMRMASTLSSDAAWEAGHRASARATAIAGWGPILGGAGVVVLTLVTPPTDATMIAAAVVLVGATVWLMVWSLVGAAQARRAAERTTDPGPSTTA